MAKTHGNDGRVKIGSDVIAHVKSWSLDESAALADASSMGDAGTSDLAGMKSWSASIEVHFDPTDTPGQAALAVGASVALDLYPVGDASGAAYRSGTALVESIANQVDRGDVSSASIRVKGQGVLTTAAVA